jgi:hypothetical protein
MPDDPVKSTKHVLEPNERIAEVLFGLIMVLTFTGSLSVAEAAALKSARCSSARWAAIWPGALSTPCCI